MGHPWLGATAATGVLGATNTLGIKTGARLQSALGDLLMDPQAFRPYLQDQIMAASAPAKTKAQALAAALQRGLIPTAAVGGTALPSQ